MIAAALIVPLCAAAPAAAALQEAPDGAAPACAPWLDAHLEDVLAFYRDLHAHPELSFREERTAGRMHAVLEEAGFEATGGVGGHGVVGVLRNGEGPTVLLRADMDALPIVEATGAAYASEARVTDEQGREVGVMHACGHDAHMAVWAGTARFLAARRDLWSGTLVMIGQPAEERGAGAKAMIADGLFERYPEPDACLALHVKAELPTGTIGSCPGWALANVDTVDVRVRGRGGHGSTPHLTHDPVALSARIVMGLQTIVSREVPPLEPAVISVGSIHGGTKSNIIPDEVRLEITVRSYEPEIRALLLDGIRRVAEHEARAAGFPEELLPEVEISELEFTPATYNDPGLAQRVNGAIRARLGESAVVPVEAVMGGEDFGRYGPAAECPSYLMWLGVTDPARLRAAEEAGRKVPSVHTAEFLPDAPAALRTGVAAMTTAALELLGGPDAG